MKYDSKRIETAFGSKERALEDMGLADLSRAAVGAWFQRNAGDVTSLNRHADPAYVGTCLGRALPLTETRMRGAAVWTEACRAYLEETFGKDLPEPSEDARARQRTVEAGMRQFIDPKS